MFEVPTTIVLGAGASWSYGYPLGDELIDKIVEASESPNTTIEGGRAIYNHAYSENLNRGLKFYSPISIDSFLKHYDRVEHEDLISAAKFAITKTLLTSSSAEHFQRNAGKAIQVNGQRIVEKTHWYRYLWNAIVSGLAPDEIADPDRNHKFSVITFNYDTSLEYFLYKCVFDDASMFSAEQKSALWASLLNRIHHVYGEVEDYSQTDLNNNLPVNYSSQNSMGQVEAARERQGRIKLIGERAEADYERYKGIIKACNQVIFLGFGFDEINCKDVLGLAPHVLKSKMIKYTNFGDSMIVDNMVRECAGNDRNTPKTKSTKKVYQALEQDFRLDRR